MKIELPLLPYLEVGESARLAVEVSDAEGRDGHADRVISWRSTDSDVVRVEADGVLAARSVGQATISVEAQCGDDSASAELDLRVISPETPTVSLRPDHPRIRFTPEEVRERQAAIARGNLPNLGVDLQRQFQELLARADEFVTETEFTVTYQAIGLTVTHPVPVTQPAPRPQPWEGIDYPYWTMLSRAIETRLSTLTMAYTLTGEQRYAERAREQLLTLAGWRKWHEYDRASGNLSLPHLTIGAAIAYDELWSLLSEEERDTIRSSILNLGLRPMSYLFHERIDHNIPILLNIAMIVGYLAIGDELPHLAKFFNLPLATLRWYMEQREAGTTTEGLLYTAYAQNYLLNTATQIRRATGNEDLWQYPFITSTLPEQFLYFRDGKGEVANLSDAHYEDSGAPLLAILAQERAHPIAAWLLHRYHRDKPSVFTHLTRDLPVASPTELGLPPSKVFPRMGWAALRSGWGDDDILLAFTAGSSAAGHNHFDQNHFILNVAGEWLLTDPGYQNYEPGPENFFTNATLGHNALLVNGEGQTVKGHAQIAAHFLAPHVDYVAGDATGAYEGKIQQWVRKIIFVKPWYFLVVDEIVPAATDDTLDILFHTQGTMSRAGNPLTIGDEFAGSGDGIVITGEHAGVRLQFASPPNLRFAYEQYPGAERFGTYLRVRPAPADRHRLVTLLQPWRDDQQMEPFTVRTEDVDGALRLIVDRGEERDEHHFADADTGNLKRFSMGEIDGQASYAMISRRGSALPSFAIALDEKRQLATLRLPAGTHKVRYRRAEQ